MDGTRSFSFRAKLLLIVATTMTTSQAAFSAQAAAPAVATDPTDGEVVLPTKSQDWRASLVIDTEETGIWTVGCFDVFDAYGAREVVGLDDLGRCHVLVSYSGKWTPQSRVHDGKWLGGLAHGDVDPRVAGRELYVGGQAGNIYQLVAWPHGALDARLIAHVPGREVHTLVAGDFDPRSAGSEVLAFTSPGGLYRLSPSGPHGTFKIELLEELSGRVRDAVLLPAEPGRPAEIATVSRAGKLEIVSIDAQGTHWRTVHQEWMGMGRIALRAPTDGAPLVLYSTLDDGRILRHEQVAAGEWRTETIYAGPQGPRGIAAGRFSADATAETVAVFGYAKTVQLLTRRGGAWSVEDVFEDRAGGHWLSAVELDGRNGTQEILGSGYGGRIFLLARPPGYGTSGVLTAPEAPRASDRPVRELVHAAGGGRTGGDEVRD